MSDIITEPAPAKINLALHVRRRRADGYHDIETLFAFCADGDVVSVEQAERDALTIIGPFASKLGRPHPSAADAAPSLSRRERSVGSDVPPARPEQRGALFTQHWARSPEASGKGEGDRWPLDNLVVRAADAFRGTFAVEDRYAITLDKRLPVASGIGGGSADAAATLRALARLHDIAIDDPKLTALAAALGADVPACLDGRTALGTGRGDTLAALDGLAGTPLLLVNPGIAVSTAAVFAAWDGVDRGPIGEGGLLDRAREGRNDLEASARTLAPVIGEVRALLDAAPGALLSRMSGSGATCFALFENADQRDAAAAQARKREWWTLATALR